ncbi:serine/threonine-protein kinase dst1 [Dorcoceras hygrometricum]|uniref:Serine/threonine-protein kinase dst1 n=1 Tax=Dorcoceras hygrometricum TaxID=472368 RepID=A0A2Z7DEK2_9LAMI|nr:serine/threonine-protein kinase dst1 [Dorcoceras hygrometricum]
MSRFFYIKRDGNRNPWKCEMSWRDNVFTLTPRTPDRSPNLTSFLEAMRSKSYDSPELMKEDLLCFFGFSRKGVELAGDLDACMGKAEMLQFLEETEEAAAPLKKVANKRKASTPIEKEARRQRNKGASSLGARPDRTTEERRASTPPIPTTEERPNPKPVVNIPEVSSPEKGSMKASSPGRVPPLNYFEDSLVVSPTAAVATKYLFLGGNRGGSVPLKKVAKKRKASTPIEKEARRQRNKGASSSGARSERTTEERRASTPPIPMTEERPNPTPVVNIPEVSSPEKGSMKASSPGRVPPLNYFEDSLVVSPTAAVATKYLCHVAPDRDWADWREPPTRRPWACLHRKSHRYIPELQFPAYAMRYHTKLVVQLEELKAIRDQEKKAAEAVQEMLRAQLATERSAWATEEEAMRSELEAVLNEKTVVVAELEETKARAAEEAERMRDEVANAWALRKEEFHKSPEFERLCAKKLVAYFRSGFEGCVAQFRANGYPEEKHPAPFLDAKKALRDMPEDEGGRGRGGLGR